MTDGGDDSDDLDDFADFEPEERPRGILTKEDRRFLRGEKDVDEQTRRDTRYRIRERVKNSLADFSLLVDALSDEDRNTIFESLEDQGFPPVLNALVFFYSGLENVGENFEDVLATSIKRAEMLDNPERMIDVSVDIEVNEEEPDVEVVIDRLTAGEGTLDDFNYAVVKGAIVPVLEHYLDQGEELQVSPPEDDQDGHIAFPVEEMEQMRDMYARFDERSQDGESAQDT